MALNLGVILFHKNVNQYPAEWIRDCIASIKNQTYQNFRVFECDYGGTNNQIYEGSDFESKVFDNHTSAHNYLCDKAFSLGFDYVANVNIDDVFSLNRLEKQLPYMEQGYDVISSNFYNINENGHIRRLMKFHDKDIVAESNKNHNIICHPVVCYSKHFWTTCSRLNPDEIPVDDFNLWKRSYGKYRFVILPDFLCYYRVHQFKICNS